jgi:hypothetical protein
MADIGLPNISILFSGLGSSAVTRGSQGVALIIIKDDTVKTFDFATYTSVADLTTAELAKYTATNLAYINDTLLGIPTKVIVARMDVVGVLADLLVKIMAKTFDWIGIAEGTPTEQLALSTWVKAVNLTMGKRFKAVVYNVIAADMHVVNFVNTFVTYTDTRGLVTGDKYIARLVGFLAGLSLLRSAISYTFTDLSGVVEPVDNEIAVNDGEFVLFADNGVIKPARGNNSLTTIGSGITDDMKYITIVETMDLIYLDIYSTWQGSYKGLYKNTADNQHLLVSAINSYFRILEQGSLLDDAYDNLAAINTTVQRTANIPKYGDVVVAAWTDSKVNEMPVGTNIYLVANVKIPNCMEDINLTIYM